MFLALIALTVLGAGGAIYGGINADIYWPEASVYLALALASWIISFLVRGSGTFIAVVIMVLVCIALLFRLGIADATA